MRPLAGLLLFALAGAPLVAGPVPLELNLRRLDDAGYRHRTPGVVNDAAVAEISGLAASRRADERLWALNDSDNGNLLHLLATDGRRLGTWPVDGARNYDWEDLSSFVRDGEAWLLIADTGDNGGLRESIELIAVREPDPAAAPAPVPVAWRLEVRWPDGPRDCEAIAVDVAAGEILLVAKKRVPTQMFRVPLPRAGEPVPTVVAEPIATIAGIPQPTDDDLRRAPPGARYMSQVTSADLSPDGLRLVLLTYREAYLMSRTAGEPWLEALRRAPQRLRMPPLVQAEAIAFDRDGERIWIGTEKLPAPLVRFDPR
ncbi:MAG: hypothetical protein LW860_00495 [Xanthomonadaceae bacterium]|nr:hypothetical protein [Xanthomonadaceae bacterium]